MLQRDLLCTAATVTLDAMVNQATQKALMLQGGNSNCTVT
jgi:hypothetical protein